MMELTFAEQNSFLHHGIEGQKWGVRNGPPYPLDRGSSQGSKKDFKDIQKQLKKDPEKVIKNACQDPNIKKAINTLKNSEYMKIYSDKDALKSVYYEYYNQYFPNPTKEEKEDLDYGYKNFPSTGSEWDNVADYYIREKLKKDTDEIDEDFEEKRKALAKECYTIASKISKGHEKDVYIRYDERNHKFPPKPLSNILFEEINDYSKFEADSLYGDLLYNHRKYGSKLTKIRPITESEIKEWGFTDEDYSKMYEHLKKSFE